MPRKLPSLMVLLPLLACGDSTSHDPVVVPQGLRHFGFHVTAAADTNFDLAYQLARQAGMDQIPLSVAWTSLQTDQGWDLAQFDFIVSYIAAQGLPIYLTIPSPINTIVPDVPAAFQGLAHDDTLLINGFAAFLDTLHAHTLPLDIRVLNIGNEIDGTLGADAVAWARYRTLFVAERDRAKSLWGNGLLVGTTLTAEGLLAYGAPIDSILALTDLASVTYYPIAPGTQAKPPTVAAGDIDAIVARITTLPIYFQEVGYPTSAANGSSEEAQRQFAVEVFQAWDRHADRIRYVGWLWLTDLSQAQTDQLLQYYGLVGATAFGEFLRTLGVRTHAGADKTAFTEIHQQLNARGWGP